MLNSLRQLFSSIAKPSNLAAAPPTAAQPTAKPRIEFTGQRGGYCARAPQGQPLDDNFVLRYGTPDYMPGIVWRHGDFHIPNPPTIYRELIEELLPRPLFKPDEEAQLKAIMADLAEADKKLEEYSYQRAGALFRQNFPVIGEAVRSRQPIPNMPSFDEVQKTTQTVRNEAHAWKRDRCADAYPIIRGACLRLRKRARAAVIEQERKERGLLGRWRIKFAQSEALRALIYVALMAEDPIRGWESGIPFLNVSTDPEKIWNNFYAGPPPGKGLSRHEQFITNEADSEKRRNQMLADEEQKDAKAHAEALAKVSAFNDEIRTRSTAEVTQGGFMRPPKAEPPKPEPQPEPEPERDQAWHEKELARLNAENDSIRNQIPEPKPKK